MVRCVNCKNLCLPKMRKQKTVDYTDEHGKTSKAEIFPLGVKEVETKLIHMPKMTVYDVPPLLCLAGKLFAFGYTQTESTLYGTQWVTFFEYARCDRECDAYDPIPEPHKGEFT